MDSNKIFNLNNEVVIFPNNNGWEKIIHITAKKYSFSIKEAEDMVNKKRTKDGGYRDQLWVIISDFHDMFYNGQSYFRTTNIFLIG